MSVLVVGISHQTAPVEVLERLALDRDGVAKLVGDVAQCEHVTEATVLATCNRIEIYSDVDRFHGSVEEISRLLCERAGQSTESVLPHLYVHYDDGAVSHLFHVSAGLDSMVVGEGQILGQTREALRLGQEHGTVGPALNVLFQQALRVGKRSHAETDIDRAAPSMVSAALNEAVPGGRLDGLRVLVVGAGSMAALAVATAVRLGAAETAVVNRTEGNAERLAAEYAARSLPMSALATELATTDILISCTGSAGVVVPLSTLQVARAGAEKPLAIIDLALPHDVDPDAAHLPGVTLIGLRQLADDLRDTDAGREVAGVREIVNQEIGAGGRVADKLLHQPTTRVKELVNEAGAVSYAAALAELFALDPDAVDAVTRPGKPE